MKGRGAHIGLMLLGSMICISLSAQTGTKGKTERTASGEEIDTAKRGVLDPTFRNSKQASRWSGHAELNGMSSFLWQQEGIPVFRQELGFLINERFVPGKNRRLRLIYFQELGATYRTETGWWPREDRIEPGMGWIFSNPSKPITVDGELRFRTRVFPENMDGEGNALAYPRFMGPLLLFGDMGIRFQPSEKLMVQLGIAGIKVTYLHRALWPDSLQQELPPPWTEGKDILVNFGVSLRSELGLSLGKRWKFSNMTHIFCPIPDFSWTIQSHIDATVSITRSLGLTCRFRLQREEQIDARWRILADLRCVWTL